MHRARWQRLGRPADLGERNPEVDVEREGEVASVFAFTHVGGDGVD